MVAWFSKGERSEAKTIFFIALGGIFLFALQNIILLGVGRYFGVQDPLTINVITAMIVMVVFVVYYMIK